MWPNAKWGDGIGLHEVVSSWFWWVKPGRLTPAVRESLSNRRRQRRVFLQKPNTNPPNTKTQHEKADRQAVGFSCLG